MVPESREFRGQPEEASGGLQDPSVLPSPQGNPPGHLRKVLLVLVSCPVLIRRVIGSGAEPCSLGSIFVQGFVNGLSTRLAVWVFCGQMWWFFSFFGWIC